MQSREITSSDLDLLGELGNIGAGNAATALSQILNQTIHIEVPLVQICSLTEIPEKLGGAEEVRTCIFFGVSEAITGYILFMLKEDDVNYISSIAAGDYEIDSKAVLTEIANIISGAYIGAIASMINETIDITPPEVGQDMIGSLVDTAVSEIFNVADKTVIIGTKLIVDNNTISGFYVLMLEEDSLNKVLDYFNYK